MKFQVNVMHTFKASKVNLDGSLTTIDHLSQNELDGWMQWAYGKYATVSITRDDEKTKVYTDNGKKWEAIP
jgi:hypothetical protein